MELESVFSRQNPIKCLKWIGSLVVRSLHITPSLCVLKIDLSQCFRPLLNDFRVTYSDLCALSLPKRYGITSTAKHLQLFFNSRIFSKH